jgi:hypothetical protein
MRYNVAGVCVHKPENINICERVTEEAHYCLIFLQQYGPVFVNLCILEI